MPCTKTKTTPVADGEAAKQYLINNDVWDEDYAICANNIANQIATSVYNCDEEIYYAVKYGRRAIVCLLEVFHATRRERT